MNIYEVTPVSERLAGNPYVGRGIIIGMTPDAKKAVVAYFIMGRSENSRNRVFVLENGEVRTEPYDRSKVGDPSL
ncbi:MAG: IMP cyclohydrolase, partial [Clostridiales bacterium]|nr:IMP cyclohydrolase [Clostridiales bacterium]